MKRIVLLLTGMIAGLTVGMAQAAETTPIGYWKTVDDATGKPKSIVRIWQAENQQLIGKVIKIFPRDGSLAQSKVCSACSGQNRNQPIVGMVILSGLKANHSQWGNGEILDPENGKTYSVSMRVADNGKKLNVHGYIGIPLLGRSQTWERIDLMSDK